MHHFSGMRRRDSEDGGFAGFFLSGGASCGCFDMVNLGQFDAIIISRSDVMKGV